VEDMANNAAYILADENLPRFRENALKRAKDFEISKILPMYEDYYREVVVGVSNGK
jgi:hypothetical protein